jgi:predicted CoA-substrate-specific enzyme activase
MNYYAGIDIESTYIKCLILDNELNILAKAKQKSGIDIKSLTKSLFEQCLFEANIPSQVISTIVLTGKGRRIINGEFKAYNIKSVPEIISISKGVSYLIANNKGKIIIDIGGEKWKAIKTDEKGNSLEFESNSLCAASTGKFLDFISKNLDMSIEEMTDKAMHYDKIININQLCGILVESAIISALSNGEKPENVFASLFYNMFMDFCKKPIIEKNVTDEIYLTGGVSANAFLKILFERKYKNVYVLDNPEYVCAYGAISYSINNN